MGVKSGRPGPQGLSPDVARGYNRLVRTGDSLNPSPPVRVLSSASFVQGDIAMTIDTVAGVRQALIEELEELRDAVHEVAGPLTEEELWRKPLTPGNSVGHLILHLTGNLNHFVGAQLGGSGYERDREREFTETQPPTKAVLLANLDAAVATFGRVVGQFGAEQLTAAHPHAKLGSVLKALVHLVAHFALHRGQMTYIVRLVKPST
jgi:uncharacterized damage-inducible protein DinB